jgi:hypothetical protein
MDSTQIYGWFSVNDSNHKGIDYRVHTHESLCHSAFFCMSSNLSFVCVSCHNVPFFIHVQGRGRDIASKASISASSCILSSLGAFLVESVLRKLPS